MNCSKLSYVINNFIMYFNYVFVYLYFIYKRDNSLPVYYLCLDPVMILNLMFVGVND